MEESMIFGRKKDKYPQRPWREQAKGLAYRCKRCDEYFPTILALRAHQNEHARESARRAERVRDT